MICSVHPTTVKIIIIALLIIMTSLQSIKIAFIQWFSKENIPIRSILDNISKAKYSKHQII